MGDLLDDFEATLIGTPGEKFLVHIEKDLRSTRSYKMIVLFSLLQTEQYTYEWTVQDIAERFKQYFIDNQQYLSDYAEMARAENSKIFPIKTVMAHLRKMPLNFLSNKNSDFFIESRLRQNADFCFGHRER